MGFEMIQGLPPDGEGLFVTQNVLMHKVQRIERTISLDPRIEREEYGDCWRPLRSPFFCQMAEEICNGRSYVM